MALPRYIPSYTIEDYRSWQGDWELWSGVPVAMSPSAKRVHQRLCGRLFRHFSELLESTGCEECEVAFEIDWIVREDTVFRPDLLITCHHPPSDYITQTPVLVVEILSESTRQRDLLYKREAYQELGVRYYLTIDPDTRAAQFLSLTPTGYEKQEIYLVDLHEGCRFSVALDSLFM